MTKNRTMISLRIPPELLDELDSWRESHTYPPQRTTIIVEALRLFLDTKRREAAKRGAKQ